MNFDQVVLHTILAPRTAGWSVWMDSNHRPRADQARALATWATDRFPHLAYWLVPLAVLTAGGDEGNRTLDPLLAGQVLSQLSYTPILWVTQVFIFTIKTWQLNNKIHKYFLAYTPSAWVVCFLSYLTTSHQLLYRSYAHCLHRKEVIQPHLPIRLPCYDLTPIIEPTLGSYLLAVSILTLGVSDFHGLTGGVYKARERIHRGMLTRDY